VAAANGTYRYKLDNSNLNSGATQTTSTSFTPSSALSEGSHTLYVQERDDAGNWSSPGSRTIVIDTTDPNAPVITTDGGNGSGENYSTDDSSITLEGACPADTNAIYVNDSTDGVTYTPGQISWSYSGILQSGENTFNITAIDAAGNVSNVDSITVTYSPSPPPEIKEVIPHNGAGIIDNTRVPNNTSFAVRIEDGDGIDITDTVSIEFTINDGGVNNLYTRDLNNTIVVKKILTGDPNTQVTKLWVVYHRSKEAGLGNYAYDANINIKVDAKDTKGSAMTQVS